MKIIIFMLTRRRLIGRRCHISPDVFRVNFTFSLNVSCVYVIKQYIVSHCLKAKTLIFKMIYNIHLAFCIRKKFQLQTGVFLKRPDVMTFDDTYFPATHMINTILQLLYFDTNLSSCTQSRTPERTLTMDETVL